MIGVNIMNRYEFLEYFENCETYYLKERIEEISMWITWKSFKDLLKIDDNSIDEWIEELLSKMEDLEDFYEQTRGSSHKSIQIAEYDLHYDIDSHLGVIEDFMIKYKDVLLSQEEIDMIESC